ncbi:diiron oxygenase [Rhodococcus sp. OK302]|uniref:diiron oxygenase n=1 Tax=Rhodococcus sp. OK302 TaxID=1882769 RepID=UPI000B9416ED|nr:diiron oxygenase [Rhodococcus sp. OK302]OYD68950.1 para-aminobenzoate N-oxygenase AurF [Rhodococcus sp. OK302]
MRHGVAPPTLPGFDAEDPAESAIVRRLAENWSRRAAVKRSELELEDLFDTTKLDYPDSLLPFAQHPTYLALTPEQQVRLRAWAWIAFNKNVMDIERAVVNPGFELLAVDAFDIGFGDSVEVAVNQAMVDEQYHTLMHLNASSLTRRGRGLSLPTKLLPEVQTVRSRAQALAECPDARSRAVVSLAYMTVAEISISSYLDVIIDGEEIQPVNRATVRLHNRDELCHASIADALAVSVFEALDADARRRFADGAAEAMAAFAGNDFGAWQAIMDAEEISGGNRMIEDIKHSPGSELLVQDFSGIRKLFDTLGVDKHLP